MVDSPHAARMRRRTARPERPDAHASRRRWNGLRDLRLQNKGLLVVGIPMVAMVAIALIFSNLLDHQRRAQTLVDHTLNVRRQIQLVLTLMVDAETGARGYVLSRRPEFLEPLQAAQRQLTGELQTLKRSLGRETSQAARVDQLQRLATQRLDVITRMTSGIEAGAIDQAQIEPLLLEGKSLMDRARALFAQMQVEERALQQGQLRALQKQNRRLQLVLWAGLVGGLLGGLAADVLVAGSVVSRMRKLNENAGLLSEGKPLEQLPPGDDEIGQLGQRMEAAGKLLRAREEELAAVGEELREGLSLLRATFDATTDGIAAVDTDGRLILHNARFLDMWNVRAPALTEEQETGGRPAVWAEMTSRLKDPEASLAALRPMIEAREAKGSTILELKTGEIFEVRFHPQRIGDKVIGRVWSVHDVTESHRHQESLERARREAEAAQAEAERAQAEAERANRAKSEFLSRMSHELRTPLNAILGFGQLLEMEVAEPEGRGSSVRQILKAGKHLLGLINEVLDISRIESGRLALSIEEVHLGDVIAEILDLVAPMAASGGITLEGSELSHAGWKAQADRQRLKQVLLNLVSNAVKYSPRGASVRLSAGYTDEGRVRLAVIDTGPGIAEENLDRLFTPFERIGAELTQIEGTGLGLALSKRLAEAMGGAIGVESRLGEGSTFWVDLTPVETAALDLDAPPTDQVVRLDDSSGVAGGPAASSEPVEPVEPVEPNGSLPRMKLLYIEDNVSNLRLIERLVERRPDIELLTALQGGLGIELARSHRPGLIFLDLHLPDIHGVDVLEALRSDPTTSEIPVIILSADATPGQVERLLEAGANDYLTKPLDLRRILGFLDDATARQRAGG